MELWDIYDANKQLTGKTMVRDDWNMAPDEFHLTVQGAVKNTDGRFLITQRDESKPWAAGHWEVSGGGVQAGETSNEAIVREIKEETGVDVGFAKGGLQFTYKRVNPQEKDNYFVDVYLFETPVNEAEVTLQEGETQNWMLATKEEIKYLGEKGIFMHYDSIKDIFGITEETKAKAPKGEYENQERKSSNKSTLLTMAILLLVCVVPMVILVNTSWFQGKSAEKQQEFLATSVSETTETQTLDELLEGVVNE